MYCHNAEAPINTIQLKHGTCTAVEMILTAAKLTGRA